MHQRIADWIASESAIPLDHVPGDAGVPETLDLQSKKRNLLCRIEQAQVSIELEAIDHTDRMRDTDMLGSQIPVSFHHLCTPQTQPDVLARDEIQLPLADGFCQRAGLRVRRCHGACVSTYLVA